MALKLSIFVTTDNWKTREEPYHEAMKCYRDLADEVIEVDDKWPDEFSWEFIGQQFQKGYERATGDWVIHCDLDYFFHEDDHEKIRRALLSSEEPALTFWKYMFYNPKKYTLKSRLAIAVNKKKYGNKIKFDGGGDLSQPTLDGVLLDHSRVPEARIPFYCYDALLKTKEQHRTDRARFASAYYRKFGNYGHGKPETALEDWLQMVRGRYQKHHDFDGTHPKYIEQAIADLKPENFSYNGWGMFQNGDRTK